MAAGGYRGQLLLSRYVWSSVHAHLAGKDDGLATVAPVLRRIADFTAFVAEQANDTGFAALRRAE